MFGTQAPDSGNAENSRRLRNGRLADSQLTQDAIARSRIELEQFRLLLLRTAWLIDKHQDYRAVRGDIAAVKVAMPDVYHSVAARAMHLHGALGMSNELPFAKMLVDAQVMGTVDGPTEVHAFNPRSRYCATPSPATSCGLLATCRPCARKRGRRSLTSWSTMLLNSEVLSLRWSLVEGDLAKPVSVGPSVGRALGQLIHAPGGPPHDALSGPVELRAQFYQRQRVDYPWLPERLNRSLQQASRTLDQPVPHGAGDSQLGDLEPVKVAGAKCRYLLDDGLDGAGELTDSAPCLCPRRIWSKARFGGLRGDSSDWCPIGSCGEESQGPG